MLTGPVALIPIVLLQVSASILGKTLSPGHLSERLALRSPVLRLNTVLVLMLLQRLIGFASSFLTFAAHLHARLSSTVTMCLQSK